MPSVFPAWMSALPMQQQSVLLLAARGPDGIAKFHPTKTVVRAYRGTVLLAAKYGAQLEYGRGDTFMNIDPLRLESTWCDALRTFFEHADDLPHHYLMHLAHGAEILGYKHPVTNPFRNRWREFYERVCFENHVTPETEEQLDERLSDWGMQHWKGQGF